MLRSDHLRGLGRTTNAAWSPGGRRALDGVAAPAVFPMGSRPTARRDAMAPACGWTLGVVAWLTLVSAYLFTLQAYRFFNLSLGVRDLGFFAQSLWNSLHGAFLAISIGHLGGHLWSEHFYLAHALLIPVYAIWPSPLLLLAVQSAAVGATGWGVYLLGRVWLTRPWMAALVTLAYTLHPAVHGAALGLHFYGYHPDVVIPPLFLFCTYYLVVGRSRAALACWLLGLSVAEQYAVIWAGLGAFLALRSSTRRLGIGMAAGSASWLALATLAVIPYFAGGKWPYYFSGLTGFQRLGMPDEASAVGQQTVSYLFSLLRPFGYLPLLDAFSLIVLPVCLIYASAWKAGYVIPLMSTSWHSSAILPVISVALLRTVGGISWFGSRMRHYMSERFWVGFVAASAILPVIVVPDLVIPPRYGIFPGDFRTLSAARRAALEEVRRLIPQDAVLATDFFTGSQFLHRRQLRLVATGWADAEYVLVDQRHRFGGPWKEERAALQALRSEAQALRVFDREGFVLIRRFPRVFAPAED